MAELEVKFNKGLNSAIDFMADAPGHCLTFSDYRQDYGILRPRQAMGIANSSPVGSSSDTLDGLFFWGDPSQAQFNYNGGQFFINDASNSKFYRSSVWAGSTFTVTDITNAVSQNTAPIIFASLNGILVYTGFQGNVNQITSKSANCATLAGKSANFSMVRTVNNIMFGAVGSAGAASTNSTVYWSSVGDPTTWPGASNITFRNNDGDSIQALGELNGQLLIFKHESIGLLQTTSITVSGTVTLGPLTTLFQGVGCVSPNAVDNLPDGRCIFFAPDFNIYVTDGATVTTLTNNPPPGINISDSLSSSVGLFGNYVSLRYFPYRNEIILAGISTSGAAPYCYAYDIQQQYWRTITGIHPYSMCVLNNPQSLNQRSNLMIGNNVGNVINAVIGPNTNTNPLKEDGVTLVTPDVSASVVIPQNFFNEGLVCLTILYKTNGNTVSFRYGFDNTYGSSLTLPAANNRVDLKVQLKQLSNNQRPTTFQIDFQDNGGGLGGASIYKIMLSDEVTA